MVKKDVDYNSWHSSHSVDDDINAPWHLFIKEKLKTISIAQATILEIGCGRGGFSNYIANTYSKVKKIFSSDFSIEALRIANEKFGSHNGLIQWQQEDIMSLSYQNDSFDIVISCETIEHVPNTHKAIHELYRVLKPGGTLLLTCPNYFNPFGVWCLYRWMIGKPFTEGGQPYVNYLQMPIVYYLIRKAGFKIIQWQASEIIIPARVPKHFWNQKIPSVLKAFGYRTYYVLKKI